MPASRTKSAPKASHRPTSCAAPTSSSATAASLQAAASSGGSGGSRSRRRLGAMAFPAPPSPAAHASVDRAECNFLVMELTKVFRQDHPVFIATLEKIRRGICDDECTRFLANCGAELGKGGNIDIQPTNLYPLRKAVDDENRREFEKLKEQAYTFQALDDSRGAYAESVLGERVRQPLSVKTRD
ncbi:hypothetical protein BJY59DRAFT_534208 [Rhodotorula toruloides]